MIEWRLYCDNKFTRVIEGETRAGEAAHTPKQVATKVAATANRRIVLVRI
jgi:hypothetical protein